MTLGHDRADRGTTDSDEAIVAQVLVGDRLVLLAAQLMVLAAGVNGVLPPVGFRLRRPNWIARF